MHKLTAGLVALATALGLAAAAGAGDGGAWSWAFPGPAGKPSPPKPPNARVRLAGSRLSFTRAQLGDLYHAVDWRPDSHPPAPLIVRQGHAPAAMACGYCHLPAGEGRPENAALAGLPAAYIEQQLADIRTGARQEANPAFKPAQLMTAVARAASPAEAKAAAAYFAGLRFTSRVKVVEAAMIPAVADDGYVWRRLPGPGRVPLGQRIIEGPSDFERFELRDARTDYFAYVPPGAIARGSALASSGGQGRTQVCSGCHGEHLKGALGPPLAGRSPSYIVRQLYAFQTGARHGAGGAAMTTVAAKLTPAEMIDLAAYAAALRP